MSPDPPRRRDGEPRLRGDRRGRRRQRLGGLRGAGHDFDGDLGDGVGVQAERGAALGHHAADEVLAHREHDVKKARKTGKKDGDTGWSIWSKSWVGLDFSLSAWFCLRGMHM